MMTYINPVNNGTPPGHHSNDNVPTRAPRIIDETNTTTHVLSGLWPFQQHDYAAADKEATATEMKSPSLRIQQPPSISLPLSAAPHIIKATPPPPPPYGLPDGTTALQEQQHVAATTTGRNSSSSSSSVHVDLQVLRDALEKTRLERDLLLADKQARQAQAQVEFTEVNPLPMALQRKHFEAKARLDSEKIQKLAAERADLADTLRAAQAESRTRQAAEVQDKAAKVADQLRQLEAENDSLRGQVTVAKGLADAAKELVNEKQQIITDLERRLRSAEQQDKGSAVTMSLLLDNATLEIKHLNDLVAAKQAKIDELLREQNEHATQLVGSKAMVDAAHAEAKRATDRMTALEEQHAAQQQQLLLLQQQQQQQQQQPQVVVTVQPSDDPPPAFRTQAAVTTDKGNVLATRIAAMETTAVENHKTIQKLQSQLAAAEARKPFCC
jgi:hypothetical protein